MKNKYLQELEKLNKELSEKTSEEIFNLFKDLDIIHSEVYADLENFILNSEVENETR